MIVTVMVILTIKMVMVMLVVMSGPERWLAYARYATLPATLSGEDQTDSQTDILLIRPNHCLPLSVTH